MGLCLISLLVVWAVVTVSRPVGLIVKIHVVLTALVIVAYVANLGLGLWLHSLAYSNPERKHWEPTFKIAGDIIVYLAIVWILVTIFHFVLMMRGKPRV